MLASKGSGIPRGLPSPALEGILRFPTPWRLAARPADAFDPSVHGRP
jgi:hypothetical protein